MLLQRGRFLVLADDGALRGCVYVEISGDRGYFGMLSVDPSRQRLGLGRRLVEASEQFCRDAGCTSMELHVVSLRAELPPFYRKLGYEETGTQEFSPTEEWTQPCHFIVMMKRL